MDEARRKLLAAEIIKVVSYLDIFSYPVTSRECWRYLGIRASQAEVELVLKELAAEQLSRQGAFYFLRKREKNLFERGRRFNYSDRKLKRARRVTWLFGFIPWIRLVAIGNMMGSNNLKDGSDIDFFIITEPGRIWTVRFLTTFLTKLLLLRPRVNDVRDKVCLSFYLAGDRLALDQFHLAGQADVYFSYWLAGLLPVFDQGGAYAELLRHNAWLYQAFPNWEPISPSPYRQTGLNLAQRISRLVLLPLGCLESLFRRFQLKILPNELRQAMNKDTCVIIRDDILKLHVKDRRAEYRTEYQEKIKQFSI